jgi:hypothetical protein
MLGLVKAVDRFDPQHGSAVMRRGRYTCLDGPRSSRFS